jgi:hypothetical protein
MEEFMVSQVQRIRSIRMIGTLRSLRTNLAVLSRGDFSNLDSLHLTVPGTAICEIEDDDTWRRMQPKIKVKHLSLTGVMFPETFHGSRALKCLELRTADIVPDRLISLLRDCRELQLLTLAGLSGHYPSNEDSAWIRSCSSEVMLPYLHTLNILGNDAVITGGLLRLVRPSTECHYRIEIVGPPSPVPDPVSLILPPLSSVARVLATTKHLDLNFDESPSKSSFRALREGPVVNSQGVIFDAAGFPMVAEMIMHLATQACSTTAASLSICLPPAVYQEKDSEKRRPIISWADVFQRFNALTSLSVDMNGNELDDEMWPVPALHPSVLPSLKKLRLSSVVASSSSLATLRCMLKVRAVEAGVAPLERLYINVDGPSSRWQGTQDGSTNTGIIVNALDPFAVEIFYLGQEAV